MLSTLPENDQSEVLLYSSSTSISNFEKLAHDFANLLEVSLTLKSWAFKMWFESSIGNLNQAWDLIELSSLNSSQSLSSNTYSLLSRYFGAAGFSWQPNRYSNGYFCCFISCLPRSPLLRLFPEWRVALSFSLWPGMERSVDWSLLVVTSLLFSSEYKNLEQWYIRYSSRPLANNIAEFPSRCSYS